MISRITGNRKKSHDSVDGRRLIRSAAGLILSSRVPVTEPTFELYISDGQTNTGLLVILQLPWSRIPALKGKSGTLLNFPELMDIVKNSGGYYPYDITNSITNGEIDSRAKLATQAEEQHIYSQIPPDQTEITCCISAW